MKESREQAWKATAEKAGKNNINFIDDISNLNNDDSFAPINEEEEKQPLTEEEKAEVRKKLFVLLIVIVIVLILLIVILIFDPFNDSSTDKKEADEILTEEKEADDKEEPEQTKTSLNTMADGEIALDNTEINLLIDEIEYRTYEYYENDTMALYASNNVSISSLDNTNKLFLMSKTTDFNSLIKKSIDETSICDSNITIDTPAVANILKERFNTTVSLYEDFIFNYYKDETYIKTFKFTNVNGKYVGSCYTPNTEVEKLAQIVVTKATKSGTNLYVDSQVVFVREDGVYKDPTFKTLITNNQAAVLDDYIGSGNTYRYTYDISGSNYYLTSVSLLK